ncbi:MAG TPA: glutamate--tRNA ligase, partial [Phenylobacterium sp.]|nr:glutamate--tRNA ligase [Phenylobacterium sp.]
HYIRQAAPERLTSLVAAIHESRGRPTPAAQLAVLERTIPLVRDGAKTLLELADATAFVLDQRPLQMPEKAASLLSGETPPRLTRLKARLVEAADWSVPALEGLIRGFAESESVGIGKFGPALRMCL